MPEIQTTKMRDRHGSFVLSIADGNGFSARVDVYPHWYPGAARDDLIAIARAMLRDAWERRA
jgi:hypothetical protein